MSDLLKLQRFARENGMDVGLGTIGLDFVVFKLYGSRMGNWPILGSSLEAAKIELGLWYHRVSKRSNHDAQAIDMNEVMERNEKEVPRL